WEASWPLARRDVRNRCTNTERQRDCWPRSDQRRRLMSHTVELQPQLDRFRDDFETLRREIGKVIVGQDDIVRGTLTSLLAGGHVLLEGVPGLGKTLLVRTLADALS